MIKFIFAKSLLYLCLFEFIYYIRLIETKLINKYFSFNDSIFFTFLMSIGEIIGGSSVYFFIRITSKKKKKMSYLNCYKKFKEINLLLNWVSFQIY